MHRCLSFGSDAADLNFMVMAFFFRKSLIRGIFVGKLNFGLTEMGTKEMTFLSSLLLTSPATAEGGVQFSSSLEISGVEQGD